MAIVAFVAAWQQHVTTASALNHPSIALPNSLLEHARTAVYVVTESTLVTVALLSIIWRIRGNIDRWEPGQWIALLTTVDFAWHVFSTSVSLMIARDHRVWWYMGPFLWWELTKSLVFATRFSFLGYLESESRTWRIAFWTLAAYELFQITNCIALIYENWNDSTQVLTDWTLEAIMSSTTPALIVRHTVVAIAAALNLRWGKRLSWAHWAAIVAWLSQFAIMFW